MERKTGSAAKPGYHSGGGEIIKPQCHTCKHWAGDLTCAAFPGGIPMGILMNAIDHKKHVDGDGGIKYEPKG